MAAVRSPGDDAALVDAGAATKGGLMDNGGALEEQPQLPAKLQLETQPRQAGLLDRARAALGEVVEAVGESVDDSWDVSRGTVGNAVDAVDEFADEAKRRMSESLSDDSGRSRPRGASGDAFDFVKSAMTDALESTEALAKDFSSRLNEGLEAVRQRVRSASGQSGEVAGSDELGARVAEKVKSTAESAAEQASAAVEQLESQAAEIGEQVQEAAHAVGEAANDALEETSKEPDGAADVTASDAAEATPSSDVHQ